MGFLIFLAFLKEDEMTTNNIFLAFFNHDIFVNKEDEMTTINNKGATTTTVRTTKQEEQQQNRSNKRDAT